MSFSESVWLVKFGKPVTASGFNGIHRGEVSGVFLLVDRESLLVLVHANVEPASLSVAECSRTEVQTARAEFVRHLSILVVSKKLGGCKILLVVQISLWA